MTQTQWSAVDRYITDRLIAPDTVLEEALRASDAAGMPAINVSPNQGKLLSLLAELQNARAILEIGTLGGYSTIWLARALPAGGRLITLEANAEYAEVARANIDRAGLLDRVEVRVGKALDSLPRLREANTGPFDLAFIDADKSNNPQYFTWALELSRPGGLIIVDNVVRDGAIVDAGSKDPNILGTRKLYEMLATEPRVRATAIQTVGTKGYDGFLLARVADTNTR